MLVMKILKNPVKIKLPKILTLSVLRLIKMYATNPIKENKMLLAYKNIKISSNEQQQAHEAIKDLQQTIKEVQNVSND